MSLSCTISEMLSITSQNLKRSCDRDHAHLRDYLSIWRQISDSIFIHYKHMKGNPKCKDSGGLGIIKDQRQCYHLIECILPVAASWVYAHYSRLVSVISACVVVWYCVLLSFVVVVLHSNCCGLICWILASGTRERIRFKVSARVRVTCKQCVMQMVINCRCYSRTG